MLFLEATPLWARGGVANQFRGFFRGDRVFVVLLFVVAFRFFVDLSALSLACKPSPFLKGHVPASVRAPATKGGFTDFLRAKSQGSSNGIRTHKLEEPARRLNYNVMPPTTAI